MKFIRMLSTVLLLCLVVSSAVSCSDDGIDDPDFQAVISDEVTNYVLLDITYISADMKEENGKIVVELYPNIAPQTVQNFKNLVADGFYDGLTFHRIYEGFMIQGGDPDGDGSGGSPNKIKGEFEANGFDNPLSHERGVISMARASYSYDSASSQFFIMHADSDFLDGQYAAFGRVIYGMSTVDAIADTRVVYNSSGERSKPVTPPVINSAKFVTVAGDAVTQSNQTAASTTIENFINSTVDHTTVEHSVLSSSGTEPSPALTSTTALTSQPQETSTPTPATTHLTQPPATTAENTPTTEITTEASVPTTEITTETSVPTTEITTEASVPTTEITTEASVPTVEITTGTSASTIETTTTTTTTQSETTYTSTTNASITEGELPEPSTPNHNDLDFSAITRNNYKQTDTVTEYVCLRISFTDESGTDQTEEIVIRLFPDVAPLTVSNFQMHVQNGFYDGTVFHRIVKNSAIYGGKDSSSLIDGEFSDNGFENNLLHVRGVVSMDRDRSYQSASARFMILQTANPTLNGRYAAFGFVVYGMETVDAIARTALTYNPDLWDYSAPANPVTVLEACVLTPQES